MDTDSEDSQNWIPAKSTKLQNSRKRKISEQKNNNNNSSTPLPTKWLQDIPISNSYDILDDSTETQNTTGKAVEEKKAVKPPPIYIDAEIIDPLLELLDETANEAYKDNHFNKQNVNANTDYIPVFEHNKPIRSYADVTKRTCTNSKDINSDINTEETSDIKELL
ncbi:hypothetical protein M0802_014978 [Mischocyttarus mexicanus]|nr:hypothetical protein M0802_014978 [Mischocyttarus mexicanus]